MVAPLLPLPQPGVALFDDKGKPTQPGYEFLDRLKAVVGQINASLASLNYAPTAAQYVTMAADATLTVERILAVSAALSQTDGGAGNNVTIGRAALTGDATAAADSNAMTVVKASGIFSLTGIITPAQLTADQNDYSPSGINNATILRLTTDATNRTITGLNASSNTDGRLIELCNVNALGGANILIASESASSTAANRFTGSVTILPANGRLFWYDATSSRWRTVV
jgi:hypothetical protein